MRHHQWVSDVPHAPAGPKLITTFGWMAFVFIGLVLAIAIVMTGALIWPR